MRSIGSLGALLRRLNIAPMVPNARSTVFQFRKNSSRPDVTSIGTPIHRLQLEILRNVGASMSPARRKCGARTR